MTLIHSKPICNTHECCNNNPEYPSHCEIWTNIDGCCLAQIRRPNHLQRALAWLDRHWLRIAVACLTASVFIIWSLYSMGLGATAAIDDMRAAQHHAMQQCQKGKRSMSPEIEAPRARTCSECRNYTFKPGNPKGWRWAYCEAKKKWFPESIELPGLKKGCEEFK